MQIFGMNLTPLMNDPQLDILDYGAGRATFLASGPTAPKPDRSDVTALRPAVPRERKYMERIAELYDKRGQEAKAREWRAKLLP